MPAREPSPKSAKPGNRFDEAAQFAIDVHREDTRKGSDIPYVGHLFGVCALVLEEGGSEDQAIAALLHDTAEDHGGRQMLEQVQARFGKEVMDIVEACSDTLEEPAWRPRKEAYLKRLEGDPESVLLVSLADKLYNARAITRDYEAIGEELWDRFSTRDEDERGRNAQLWYYRSLRDVFRDRAPDLRMTQEFSDVVGELERLIASHS
jgi:(p)ppGpp synthase/HD superfamily hydrolase